jgi:hypothetical protein
MWQDDSPWGSSGEAHVEAPKLSPLPSSVTLNTATGSFPTWEDEGWGRNVEHEIGSFSREESGQEERGSNDLDHSWEREVEPASAIDETPATPVFNSIDVDSHSSPAFQEDTSNEQYKVSPPFDSHPTYSPPSAISPLAYTHPEESVEEKEKDRDWGNYGDEDDLNLAPPIPRAAVTSSSPPLSNGSGWGDAENDATWRTGNENVSSGLPSFGESFSGRGKEREEVEEGWGGGWSSDSQRVERVQEEVDDQETMESRRSLNVVSLNRPPISMPNSALNYI